MIPGLGRSTGEGIGYPLQNSWAFLVAKLLNKLPAMWETWVQSLCWKDPLEKKKATHSSILAWRIPWTVFHGVTKSQTRLRDFTSLHFTSLQKHGLDPAVEGLMEVRSGLLWTRGRASLYVGAEGLAPNCLLSSQGKQDL